MATRSEPPERPRPAGRPTLAALAFDEAAAARLRRGRGTVHALREQMRTIGALLMREALTRYGNSRIGYLWAIIEPAVFIGLFLALRGYLKETVPIGENLALFLMSGIVTARVAISIQSKIGGAISSNRALLVYPLVNPLDTVAARCVLECLTGMVVIVLFFVGLMVVDEGATIVNFAVFSQALVVMLLLTCAMGAFNAVVSTISPAYGRVWGLLSFPLFITSGAFFVPATLPEGLLRIVWWNPILHIVEWAREGIYLDYLSVGEPAYPILLSVGLICGALAVERVFRLRVVSEQ